MLGYIPLKGWFKKEMKNADNIQHEALSDAYFYIETALEKLKIRGYNLNLLLQEIKVSDQENYLITHKEGVRLLIISELITLNKPVSAKTLAMYKNRKSTKHDIANEGRIINSLLDKEMIIRNLDTGSSLVDAPITLTKACILIIEKIVADKSFITEAMNKSRNVIIKKFLNLILE